MKWYCPSITDTEKNDFINEKTQRVSMETALSAVVLGTAVKCAIVGGSTAATTSMIVNNSGNIASWWWRNVHGCCSHRVIFGKTTTELQQHNLLMWLAKEAQKQQFRHTQAYSYQKTNNSPICTVLVPYRVIYINTGGINLYVKPLINSNGDIAGIEFWTCAWTYGGNLRHKVIMINSIAAVMSQNLIA